MVPPEEAARTAATPWTNRVGLILSVAWPIQCGVGPGDHGLKRTR